MFSRKSCCAGIFTYAAGGVNAFYQAESAIICGMSKTGTGT